MEPRHFELPVGRWDQIVDWLEAQKDHDARRAAETLVRYLNEERALPPGADATILTLYTFAGNPFETWVTAAIAATEQQPE